MKVTRCILAGLAGLVLLFVIVAFFLPRTYRVERAVTVNAKPEVIYAHVADLRAWKNWTAWHERDPQMTLSYSPTSSGPGAWSAWESKTEGKGKMTITGVEPGREVRYNLEFPDFGMTSTGSVTLAPAGNAVRVSWVSQGDLGLNPVSRWFGLFLEDMIAPDFEKGLTRLKALSESAPPPRHERT